MGQRAEAGNEGRKGRAFQMRTPGWIAKRENPYPYSVIPGLQGMFAPRDIYSIEWPKRAVRKPILTKEESAYIKEWRKLFK